MAASKAVTVTPGTGSSHGLVGLELKPITCPVMTDSGARSR